MFAGLRGHFDGLEVEDFPMQSVRCDGEGGGVRNGRKIGEIACAGEEERVVFVAAADICEECEMFRFGILFQSPNEPT